MGASVDSLVILCVLPASRVTGYLGNRSWFADHKAPGRTTLLPATECGVTLRCLAAGSDFQRLRARGPILTVPFSSLSAGKVTRQGGIFVSRVRPMGGGPDQKELATECLVDGRVWSQESPFSPQHLCLAQKFPSLVLQATFPSTLRCTAMQRVSGQEAQLDALPYIEHFVQPSFSQ